MPTPPPRDVLEAYGARADPQLLDGGRGRTWLAGDIVLKPVDLPVESHWRATVLDQIPESDAFRVARPIKAASGEWLFQGWEACRSVAGRTDPTRWREAIDTGTAFHQAITDVPRPAFLDDRDDWWSRADRASWDAVPVDADPVLKQLAECRAPVEAEGQVVHGDLLGNVMYEPGLPPAVIDWAPYWRPVVWSAAVTAADAMCWHGAPIDAMVLHPEDDAILDRFESWTQMLIRALLYRMITDLEATRAADRQWDPHPAYQPVAAALIRAASGR
jgi:uncharacterized protein (TIGR02569 family)